MLDKTSSIICAFGLASAAPRSPYRHLELCGIALKQKGCTAWICTRIIRYWPARRCCAACVRTNWTPCWTALPPVCGAMRGTKFCCWPGTKRGRSAFCWKVALPP
ncbi:MAG: hypothetical protein MR715_08300 [Subdoligranulum sp.]|nr:hypothetical protein [Subdoligranulum sp.]